MTSNQNGDTDEERRNCMVSLLARYPNLEGAELADLVDWFRKEASAQDIGIVASDPTLKVPYESLKEDHLSRLNGADLFWTILFFGGGFIMVVFSLWVTM